MRRSRKHTRRYIAVVTVEDEITSKRNNGTWSAVLGHTQEDAVTRALELCQKWNDNRPGWTDPSGRPYVVQVGELLTRAVTPRSWKLVPL